MTDIIGLFISAMQAVGLDPVGEIVADGKIHRIHIAGDRENSENGWYLLHTDDPPSGSFGSWKTGQNETWTAAVQRKLSQDEKRQLQDRINEDRKRRDDAEKLKHAEASDLALKIWNESPQASDDHAYLIKKGITAGAARLSESNRLIIPLVEASGDIASLQFIDADGSKRYLPGGKKIGCYFSIGKLTDKMLVCEGFATGQTLHAATGLCTIVCFDVGNIESVVLALKNKYPKSEIIVCADNDAFTAKPDGSPWNPGVEAARLVSRRLGTSWVKPEFTDLSTRPTDFNDLAALASLDEVKKQVETHSRAVEATILPPLTDDEPENPDGDDEDPSWGIEAIKLQLPHVKGKDRKPIASIQNLRVFLDKMGVLCRYNVISKDEELVIPNTSFSLDNKENAGYAWLESQCNVIGMPTGSLGNQMTFLADENLYNPVTEWIGSKEWDGVSRLPEFYATVTAKDEAENEGAKKYKEMLMRRWMISAVVAAFEPTGVKAQGVLVFQGAQYSGKTAWFNKLAPEHMGVIQDGLTLKPDDRDSVKQAVSFWLVELGELDATFRKSDISALKSFLTRKKDILRRAYARKESQYARRTVFFGSVNPENFLHDATGNRRYWTIQLEAIDGMHNVDMQQVWAEIYTFYKAGESHYLTQNEFLELTEQNKKFEVVDPLEDRIRTGLDWNQPPEAWTWRTSVQILGDCGIMHPSVSETTKVGVMVRHMNGNKFRRDGHGTRLLLVPRPAFASTVPGFPSNLI